MERFSRDSDLGMMIDLFDLGVMMFLGLVKFDILADSFAEMRISISYCSSSVIEFNCVKFR